MNNELTPKQKIFCNEYLIDMNATRAYKKAYPNVTKDETARVNGCKMLTKTNVKQYIESRLKKIEDKSIADAAEVLKYLTSVMRNEVTEEVVVVESCGDGMSEARKVKKDVSAKDRNKAAELLAKRYALLTEKIDQKVKVEPDESWFEKDD